VCLFLECRVYYKIQTRQNTQHAQKQQEAAEKNFRKKTTNYFYRYYLLWCFSAINPARAWNAGLASIFVTSLPLLLSVFATTLVLDAFFATFLLTVLSDAELVPLDFRFSLCGCNFGRATALLLVIGGRAATSDAATAVSDAMDALAAAAIEMAAASAAAVAAVTLAACSIVEG
jgi:VIT1/CCC1 family predicted Fe2+/Mn2+ transporter